MECVKVRDVECGCGDVEEVEKGGKGEGKRNKEERKKKGRKGMWLSRS